MRSLYNNVNRKKDFLDSTGITLSALHYVLDGKTTPNVKMISAFASYFNMPCGAMFLDYSKYHENNTMAPDMKTYEKFVILKDAIVLYNE